MKWGRQSTNVEDTRTGFPHYYSLITQFIREQIARDTMLHTPGHGMERVPITNKPLDVPQLPQIQATPLEGLPLASPAGYARPPNPSPLIADVEYNNIVWAQARRMMQELQARTNAETPKGQTVGVPRR